MLDRTEIIVKAGAGGDGMISFRREKFVPFGGPDGGDGGDGGDVIIRADSAVSNLRKFKQKRLYRAADGGRGMGKRRHGKGVESLVVTVPVGTVVSYKTDVGGAFIADLEQSGQNVVAARGGKGGLGNPHFASSTNQAPQIAQRGEAGEEHAIILEMRLIADVGIIGYPNVGKSTLLAAASASKPKIASYPFTTIEPVLGVVEVGQQGFVLAEIPGLIEGAYLGRGLGHDFLRHIMRTKMLIHLIDASSASPVEDMVEVNKELYLFDPALTQKKQLVAVNKVDLPEVHARLAEIKGAFDGAGIEAFFISASTGDGVSALMAGTVKILEKVAAEKMVIELPKKLFRPRPRVRGVSVQKQGDAFVVDVPELERIMTRTGMAGYEIQRQLKRQITRLGVNKALEKAGVRPGDKVRCGSTEWEWS
ncbi:GTPase ObgE [Chloroflexota bacterium]